MVTSLRSLTRSLNVRYTCSRKSNSHYYLQVQVSNVGLLILTSHQVLLKNGYLGCSNLYFPQKLCVCLRLTSEEVSIAVGFAPALFVSGHSRHLLSRGAAHGLIPSPLSPSHLRETENTFNIHFQEPDSTHSKLEWTHDQLHQSLCWVTYYRSSGKENTSELSLNRSRHAFYHSPKPELQIHLFPSLVMNMCIFKLNQGQGQHKTHTAAPKYLDTLKV